MRRLPFLALLPLVAGLFVWEVVYRSGLLTAANSAGPWDTARVLIRLLRSTDIYFQVGYTLYRLLTGVLLGAIVAVPVALFMSTSLGIRRLLQPTLTICANVPVVVWIPFAVMVAGTEEAFKVSLVAIAAFLIVATMVLDAAVKTHLTFLEAGRALHFDTLALIRHVVLPAVTPAIVGAIRASIAFGWVVIFFVEYASARSGSEGLGWKIADARALGRIEEEFAGLLVLAAIALLADSVLSRLQRRFLSWMHVENPG